VTVIKPAPGSRLEQLCAQHDLAKAEARKAEEALAAITDGIKNELAALLPDGATEVDLDTDLLARPLRLKAVESWRVDSKRLRAANPEIYVRYAVKSTSWRLAPIGSQT
jgi:predicted phage-related endonuclease